LAITLASDFSLECYLDIKKEDLDAEMKFRRSVITLNSLPRVARFCQVYDLVVIDEAEMVMRHLINCTMVDVQREAYELLCIICRGCKHLVIMQADISQNAVDFWAELRGVRCESPDVQSIR
jgi:hypothetical protein